MTVTMVFILCSLIFAFVSIETVVLSNIVVKLVVLTEMIHGTATTTFLQSVGVIAVTPATKTIFNLHMPSPTAIPTTYIVAVLSCRPGIKDRIC